MNAKQQLEPQMLSYVAKCLGKDGKGARVVTNQPYRAGIQATDSLLAQGITEVHNKLENITYPLKPGDYVVTGAAGEQWCVNEKKARDKYGVNPETLPFDGTSVMTKADGKMLVAVQPPMEMRGAVHTDWGDLQINDESAPHGSGDWVIFDADKLAQMLDGDYENAEIDARVVNGELFDKIYREATPDEKAEVYKDIDNDMMKNAQPLFNGCEPFKAPVDLSDGIVDIGVEDENTDDVSDGVEL